MVDTPLISAGMILIFLLYLQENWLTQKQKWQLYVTLCCHSSLLSLS